MKGVITEINKNYAVILNESSEFVKIKNNNYQLGQQIHISKQKASSLVYMAASFLILFGIMSTGYAAYYTPQKYIAVDINPSMQFEVNIFERIIKATALNPEAEKVISASNIKNRSVDHGVLQVIETAKQMGYLSPQNNNIIIDVVDNSNKTINSIDEKTKKYQQEGIKINLEKVGKDKLELSKELGLSLGRTNAITEYTDAFGGDVKRNKEMLKDTPVYKIKENVKDKIEGKIEQKIKEFKENTPQKAENTEDSKNKREEIKNMIKDYKEKKSETDNSHKDIENKKSTDETISEKQEDKPIISNENKQTEEGTKPNNNIRRALKKYVKEKNKP